MANTFSALILTAAPPGQANEAAGHAVKVDGREALLRAVELFLNRDNVTQVLVVYDQANAEDFKRKFGGHLSLFGVKIVPSSGKWLEQLSAGAEKVAAESTHVIVHDGARPCVSYADIEGILDAASKHDAVTLSAGLRSPLVELDEGGGPVATHLPGRFAQLLTPQVYKRELLQEAAKSKREIHPSKLTLLSGSALNIRIGNAGDAGLAKAMLGLLPKPKLKAPSSPFEEAQW